MPQFDSDSRGRRFGFDGLHYVDAFDDETPALLIRPMSFFEALMGAGVGVALAPRGARPVMAQGSRGWEPLGSRASQTGRYRLELTGRLTQGDVELLLKFRGAA